MAGWIDERSLETLHLPTRFASRSRAASSGSAKIGSTGTGAPSTSAGSLAQLGRPDLPKLMLSGMAGPRGGNVIRRTALPAWTRFQWP
jgi:hypothetical protein